MQDLASGVAPTMAHGGGSILEGHDEEGATSTSSIPVESTRLYARSAGTVPLQ